MSTTQTTRYRGTINHPELGAIPFQFDIAADATIEDMEAEANRVIINTLCTRGMTIKYTNRT